MMKAVIFAKKSERLPNKHLLPICSEPMIMRIYNQARKVEYFDDVLIFSKNPYLKLNANIVYDTSQGVLIDAVALAIEKFGDIFAIGGDMPLVDTELISFLIKSSPELPKYGLNEEGIPEPLLAIYGGESLDKLNSFRTMEKSVSKFLKTFGNPVNLGVHAWKAKSVNTMDDYIQVLKNIRCKDP